MDPFASAALPAYVASTVVLGLNLLLLGNATALTRGLANEVINPEDRSLNATAAIVGDGGNERTARFRRAHRNALENVPLFLVTGFLLVGVGAPAVFCGVLFAVYVAARVVHTLAYVRQLQPWRTASFVVGAIAQVAVLVALSWFTWT